MIGNAFVLAVRQISRNPLRSLLTVLGVVIGVMAVITMVTVSYTHLDVYKRQVRMSSSIRARISSMLRKDVSISTCVNSG